jgi:hypothetical protein
VETSRRTAQTRRGVLGWDIALALWVVGCVALGFWTAASVRRLEPVGDTLLVSSRALSQASDAFDRIRGIPLVGGSIGDVGDRIREISRSAHNSGVETRRSVQQISLTLPLAIVVVAVVPPLVAYLAVRRRWTRDLRSQAPHDVPAARTWEVAR